MNGYVESFTHSVGASEINGTMKTKLWKSKQKFGSPNETLEEIFRTRFEQGISLGEIRAPYLHARTAGRAAPQTTHENMSKKRSELWHGNILNGWRAFPLTKLSQTNVRPGMVSFTELYWKTCLQASPLIALLCHCSLQQSRKFRFEFCNSDESLDYKLPTVGDF
jgi:hypothetical protein